MLPKHDDDDFSTCQNLEKVLFDEVLKEWVRNVAPPVWSVKKQKFVSDTFHPDFRPLCTYVRKFVHGRLRTNYDLHYVNPMLSDGGTADVAFYVLKYMMKPSDRAVKLQQALRLNLPEDEYLKVWQMVHPRHFESECLGLGQVKFDKSDAKKYHRLSYVVEPRVLSHLRKGIELSKRMPGEPIPSFILPQDGSLRPLARYYKNHSDVFTMDDFLDFFYGNRIARADNVVIRDDYDPAQVSQSEKDFDKKVSNVQFRQTTDELDDLFEPMSDDFIDLDYV